MSPPYLLGIDLGTSSTKTAIIDHDGHLIALVSQEYSFDIPKPGWAEQDPEIWFQAAIRTIRQAVNNAQIPSEEIAAIGLAGLMHGPVCLDSRGQPLGPSIIWADQRTSNQAQRVVQTVGREQLASWTGNPIATGFMLVTWLWLREHQPEIYNQTAHLLLPKDYIRFRLTGEYGTEPSDASGTSLFDPFHLEWSAPILEAFNLIPDSLPPIYPSHEIAGTLLNEIARQTGLQPGIPVVYGGSDQACQAIGNGIIEPGTISCTIGTGGQIFAVTPMPRYDPGLRIHLFCHVLPKTWHMLAATLTAGKSLNWLRDKVFQGFSYQELVDQAGHVPPGAGGLFFLPYLAGERTPHMDPDAVGAFIGLNLKHTRAEMIRAVLEGVVMSLRQGLEILIGLEIPVNRIVTSGGASNHPLWRQLQADIFNRPIYRTQTIEASAVGAAILAGVGTGIYPDVPEACRRTVRWKPDTLKPDIENVALYNDSYQTFTRLYPSIKPIMG